MRRTFLRAGSLLRTVPRRMTRAGELGRRGMASSITSNVIIGASAVCLIGSVLGYKMFLSGGYVREKELRRAIENILDDYNYDDGSLGPVLVRLAWHTSGTWCCTTNTGGSTGATMRFKPECSDAANAGLDKARVFLEPIKEKFPDVSYADIWIFAGLVALEEMGGPHIEMRWGREDLDHGSDKIPENGRLPDAALGADHVREVFYRMGFGDKEIVALVGGGHAIGRCHTDRSGYDGPWTNSPTTFSNEFFLVLLDEDWSERPWKGPKQFEDSKWKLMMLPTDMAMRDDPLFRKYSEMYYKDAEQFKIDFSAAFKKLVELGFNDKHSCKV